MAMPKDLVGKFVGWKINMGGLSGDLRSQLLNGILANQTEEHTLQVWEPQAATAWARGVVPNRPRGRIAAGHIGFAPTPGPAKPGDLVRWGQPWSFTYLVYTPGYTTFTSFRGKWLITGPLSGCYCFTFMHRGQRKMAHVGTADDMDSKESILAKRAWKAFCERSDVSDVKGGSAADVVNHLRGEARTNSFTNPVCVAMFDPSGQPWSALLRHAKPTEPQVQGALQTWEFVAVKSLPLQPWASIKMLRTFQGDTIIDRTLEFSDQSVFKLPSR